MKIFISYAHVDSYVVKTQIVSVLESAGYEVWFDHKLLPGQDWKKELYQAIHNCNTFLYAMTSDSVDSEWCKWEFEVASSAGKDIIPVLLRKTMLPDYLASIQYADFTDGPTSDGLSKMFGALQVFSLKHATMIDPAGVPTQAIDEIDRLTRNSRLLPLFDIAFNGLTLPWVVPHDDDKYSFGSISRYQSEFFTHLNIVKLCASQVFDDNDYKKVLKIISDIEKITSEPIPEASENPLVYMVDRLEYLVHGLQSTLSGKSLAAFTTGATLAQWSVPIHDEDGTQYQRNTPRFLQTIQSLTLDITTLDNLESLLLSLSKEKYPLSSSSFRNLHDELRQILIQHDMHIP